MTGLVFPMEHPAVRALGWALLHFVWQGALVAGLAALALHLLRGRSPQARYAVGCAALGVMLTAPLATGIAAYEPAVALAAGPLPGGGAERQAVLARLAEVAQQVRPSLAWRYRVEAALPSLVAIWLLGIGVLSLRLAGGWGYAQRLARREVRPADPAWQRRLDALALRLRVSRPVRLLESARVQVPTVVGWLRPVVLLPFAASGLTPRQLEAVLLHELAHVRRHDYLVNLVQSAVEVLLFYHPGVWWVSERVREEREACCDDVAVAACGDALVYARALTELEGLRAAPAGLAMAADGGSLLHRVRRLLLPAPQPARGPAPVLLGVLLVATVAAGAAAQRALAPVPAAPAASGPASVSVPDALPGVVDPGPTGPTRPVDPEEPASPGYLAEGPAPPAEPAAPAPRAAPVPQEADTALAARIRRIAAEVRDPQERLQRLVELAPSATRSVAALDAYLDAAGTLSSSGARREALAAVLGSGSTAPRPVAAPRAETAARIRTEPAPTREALAREAAMPRRAAPAADTGASLTRRLQQAESISSSSERRRALSALLREQAGQPE